MRGSFKKGQAALEFLMTYGWAILVVLVAIGALAYFGVLSPDRFLPDKCTLPAGVACVDFLADGGANTIDVVLRNGLGFDAQNLQVFATGCTAAAAATLQNGQQATYQVTACDTTIVATGSKYQGDLNISYTNADSGLAKNIKGSLTTTPS